MVFALGPNYISHSLQGAKAEKQSRTRRDGHSSTKLVGIQKQKYNFASEAIEIQFDDLRVCFDDHASGKNVVVDLHTAHVHELSGDRFVMLTPTRRQHARSQ